MMESTHMSRQAPLGRVVPASRVNVMWDGRLGGIVAYSRV